MDYIEVSAKTVDEAITKACIELGISSDKLDVQVISEGSSGFLGFGAKPAVIKAKAIEEVFDFSDDTDVIKEDSKEPEARPVPEEAAPEQGAAAGETLHRPQDGAQVNGGTEKRESREHAEHEKVKRSPEEIVSMKASAQQFLNAVFAAMQMTVDITMEYNETYDSLDVEFAGADMGILIGKRGQTLDSLQYLTSLVVNKDLGEYTRVKLDTEDYRKRRKATLENLARNIAYKVRKTGKPVSLEPMNPYERRIIHSSLQSNKWVDTHSEGKEPYRYIIISPKKGTAHA